MRTLALLIPAMILAQTAFAQTALAQTTRPATLAQELGWYRRLWAGTYDRIGHHSPDWDTPVRRALEHQAVEWTYGDTPTGDEDDMISTNTDRALKAKCDDPLLLYIASRNREKFEGAANVKTLMTRAADAMSQDDYPALLKVYAFAHSAEYLAGGKMAKNRGLARKYYDMAMDLIPKLAVDTTIPRRRVYDVISAVADASAAITADRTAGWTRCCEIYARTSPDLSLAYYLKGRFTNDWAWEARGGDWAANVTAEGGKLFAERLKIAHDALDESYKLDPANCDAAEEMMSVGTGESFDRPTMDLWYQRAVANNPHAEDAAGNMLNYLEPKWYGSAAEMLTFARACAATNDWEHNFPMLLVDAHLMLSRYESPKGWTPMPQGKYFHEHPEAYREIKPIYEEYLKRYPASVFHRERFALIATWSQDWDRAAELFDSLGNRHNSSNDIGPIKRAKAQVAAHRSTTQPTTKKSLKRQQTPPLDGVGL